MSLSNSVRQNIKILLLIVISLVFISCSDTNNKLERVPTQYGMLKGVFHKIKPGETLHQLSVSYGISLEDILEINDLDPNDIVFVGDEIFIPTASKIINRIVVKKRKKKIVKIKEKIRKKIKRGKKRVKRKILLPKIYVNSLFWPVDGVVVSKFGKYGSFHNDGIDIAIIRDTPIKAVLSGEVIYSGYQKGYGNIVIIQHKDKIITIYAHNEKNLVKSGEKVKKNQKIALVGNSGNTERTKLHFEIRKGVKSVNPIYYLKN